LNIKIDTTFEAFLFVLGIFLVAQSATTPLVGLLFMRPALAGWREALRFRHWRWLKIGITVTPALIGWARSFLTPYFAAIQTLPLPMMVIWALLGTVTLVLLLPAFAACWWCLPAQEGERLPYWRAIVVAALISGLNHALVVLGPKLMESLLGPMVFD